MLLTEEKILRGVSVVTGIPQKTLKQTATTLEDAAAQAMYLHLCDIKGMPRAKANELIGRKDAAKWNDPLRRMRWRNAKTKAQLDRVLEMLRVRSPKAEESIAEGVWMRKNSEEVMFMDGRKFSVLDVSSRYFGKQYVGFVDDAPAVIENEAAEVKTRLAECENKIVYKNNNMYLYE